MQDELGAVMQGLKQRFQEITVGATKAVTASNAARAIALDCLVQRLITGIARDRGEWHPGLCWVALNYRLALRERGPKVHGYQQLDEEFSALQSATDALANKLKHITPAAAEWIQYPNVEGNQKNEEITALMIKCKLDLEISEIVRGEPSPIVMRLEAFSKLLGILSRQVSEEKTKAPPGKQYLPAHKNSPAFRLFFGCGTELLARGHSLKYLRPIAIAIHDWATEGVIPTSHTWEDKAERSVRAVLKDLNIK